MQSDGGALRRKRRGEVLGSSSPEKAGQIKLPLLALEEKKAKPKNWEKVILFLYWPRSVLILEFSE